MWYLENIPRVCHFYWGNDSISFLRYLTVLSFKKLNPDWKIKLYFPQKKYQGDMTWPTIHQKDKFVGKNYIDELKALEIDKVEVDFTELGIDTNIPETFKADILRWQILATEGGLWSDFDIIYCQPINKLHVNKKFNSIVDTVVCFNEAPFHHPIGFMMSCGYNEFYKFLYDKSLTSLNLQEYQSVGSELLRRYFPSLSSIRDRFSSVNPVNLKMEVIYPLDHNKIPHIFSGDHSDYITVNTIGLHWYGGHSTSAEFENTVTESNFQGFDSVLSIMIRKVI